jgi:hypothetical protein
MFFVINLNSLFLTQVAGHTMIASVPLELNNDHEMLLSIGNEDGYVSLQLLQVILHNHQLLLRILVRKLLLLAFIPLFCLF